MRANINLYNEDCLPAMKKMADNQYSLCICDPPYGINIGKSGKIGGDKPFGSKKIRHGIGLGIIKSTEYKSFNDSKPPEKEYFKQLFRVSENQIIWGINYFTNKYEFTAGRIVWDKKKTGFFSDCELAFQSFSLSIKKFEWMWNGMLQQNMSNKQKRIHPTEKPYELYKWLLKNYAKEGDKILDTHFGSLSIGIACWDYGYDLDAYEIDKDYFEAGKKRLETHKSQLQIYD